MKKTNRIATRGIVEEFKDMKVGDVVHFPIPDYNYNTIRATPSSSLAEEKCEGRSWSSRLDTKNKCVTVTRTS